MTSLRWWDGRQPSDAALSAGPELPLGGNRNSHVGRHGPCCLSAAPERQEAGSSAYCSVSLRMTDPMVLVTGATGFVGRAFVQANVGKGVRLRAALSTPDEYPVSGIETFAVGRLAVGTDWDRALDGVDVVVHCAARVHEIRESAPDPLAAFRSVNVDGTLALARAAVRQGVRRLVYLSSIKVNGESTRAGAPFLADDEASPVDPYGISKWEAEKGLLTLASETGLEITVVRPVLVYGPGVKANFLSMLRWIDRGVPLPFGAVRNSRSLLSVDNLSSLVFACLQHPAAANQVFLASDGCDLSTADLIRRVAAAMGRPARLVPIPTGIVQAMASLAGRGDHARRLLGSLQVDTDKTRSLLGWVPPVSVDEALERTARWYLATGRKRVR